MVAITSPAKATSFDPAMKHSSMLEMHKFPKVWRQQWQKQQSWDPQNTRPPASVTVHPSPDIRRHGSEASDGTMLGLQH